MKGNKDTRRGIMYVVVLAVIALVMAWLLQVIFKNIEINGKELEDNMKNKFLSK